MPSLPGFIGGSAPGQSLVGGMPRTVNWYLERTPGQGVQHQTMLVPTPGFSPWVGASAGITDFNARAGLTVDGHTWAVMGGNLYELSANQTVTKKQPVAQDANLAQIVYNGRTGGQLCIASGTNAYTYAVATNTLTQVLTGEATQVAMLDEYFLALNTTTGKLRLSNLNDGLTWDPTQFALRSAQPDPWHAMAVRGSDIVLLGSVTGDFWYDAGTSPFPLAARTGLTSSYGIVAPFSLQVMNADVFWLGQNKDGAVVVIRMHGYDPQPISSPEVANALATYARMSTITDAEAFTVEFEGHPWYVLRFPTANATWVFDLATGTWFEWLKWNSAAMRYDVGAVRMHLPAFGLHLVGDATSGTLSVMDATYGTEADGSVIRRLRRGPVVVNENLRVGISRFELLLDSGVGTSTGQGQDPQIMARFSRDGGETWGSERQAGIGKIGEYSRRVFWTRLGAPRLWVPEVSITDPVPSRIVDAFINNSAQAQAA